MNQNRCDRQTWAVVLAAGQGTRLAEATGGVAKQFLELDGAPLYWRSIKTLNAVARIRGVVVVFPPALAADETPRLERLTARDGIGLPLRVCAGGARRQDSVRHALAMLPRECDRVLIHDAARPLASPALWNGVLDALAEAAWPAGAAGVVPGLAVTDTIKTVDAEGRVLATPDRTCLRAVQTPQGFDLATLRAAHERAEAEGWDVTDDASLLERCDLPVRVVPGEAENAKLTRPEDLAMLHTATFPVPRVGYGYDVHRYAVTMPEADGAPLRGQIHSRPMVLGGVPIPGGPGVLAHSDGDVLLHALTDALLGCLGRGDIGQLFPDTDPALDNADSAIFLDHALGLAREDGFVLTHVDLTLVAQAPKIGPHREAIRRNVARLLALDPAHVNVKATTEEGLGFTGAKQGLKAVAVVTGVCQ